MESCTSVLAKPERAPRIRENYLDRNVTWWSVDETALYCGVARQTILHWSNKRWIKTRAVPRNFCVDRLSVERLCSGVKPEDAVKINRRG